MPRTFPETDTETSSATIGSLGTFWSTIFPEPGQLKSLIDSKLIAYQQIRQKLEEASDAVSRHTVRPLSVNCLKPLTFLTSSLKSVERPYKLGDDINLGEGYVLGEGATTSRFVYTLREVPPYDVSVITNSLSNPTVMLFEGTDFEVDGDSVIFQTNPADRDDITRVPIYDAQHTVSDEVVLLWYFRPQIDNNTLSRQFGYEIGMNFVSSIASMSFMNAVFDMLVDGPKAGSVGKALSAMLGAPLANGSETVVAISRDQHGSFVATDKYVYRYGEDATAAVEVGDDVVAGQSLTDAFYFQPLTADSPLPYLTVQSEMLGFCSLGDLTFLNSAQATTVSTSMGYTKIRWPLTGASSDVSSFFNKAHVNGIARINQADSCGNVERRGTIAHWLDNRKNPATEPTASNLPATINPFKFLCDNCLQGGAWLAKIRLASCSSNGIGLQYMQPLRKFLPADVVIVFAVETSDADDSIKDWLHDVTILPAT